MALYRTEMLSAGRHTSLLMYSRLLSNYVASAVEELDLDGQCRDYHSWLYRFYKGAIQGDLPQIGPYHPDWRADPDQDQQTPPPKASLPFLIVDEAQDLPNEFFLLATPPRAPPHRVRRRKPEAEGGELHNRGDQTHARASRPRPHAHRRNYRNTQEIAELARCFYTGLPTGIPDLPERGGRASPYSAEPTLNETVEIHRALRAQSTPIWRSASLLRRGDCRRSSSTG